MANANLADGRPQTAPKVKEWLFDPFTYIAGGKSLLIGAAAILLAGLVGSLGNTHFDGVLDIHTGRPEALWVFLAEGIIDWLFLAIILFITGKIVSKRAFRAIDLLGTQAMARWPTLFSAAASLLPPYQRFLTNLPGLLQGSGGFQVHFAEAAVAAVVMLITLAAMVWMVALMYRSYSICCNVKGARGAVSFIFGLLAAEVLSKVVLVKVLLS